MVVSLHCGVVFVLCLESRKTHVVVLSFLHPDLIRLPTNEMMLVGGPCR
jgi:WD40 repeat protein